MKKLLSNVLSATILLSASCSILTACSGGGGNGGNSAYNPDAEIQMKIVYENKGYGRDWLQATMNAYVAKNPNVSIALEEKVDLALENDFELGAKNETDIYIGNVETGYYAYLGADSIKGYDTAFVDLTELYTTANPYDTAKTTIAEKLERNGLLEYQGYHYDNTAKVKYYGVPYAGGASGFLYNSDIIKDVSAVNTTDKLVDYIYNGKGGSYSTVMWSKEGVEYMEYVMNTWIAQYEGKDGFDAIYNMKENGEDFAYEAYVKQGVLEAYKVGQEIIQYAKAYGGDLQFMAANSQFNHGAAAIMPCGNWFASELTKTDDKSVNIETSPVKFMKTPVISSIVDVLEDTSMSDDTLSAIVAEIDGGATSSQKCSQYDFDVIKDARNTVYSAGALQTAAIVSSSDQIETAKDFLLFMASEEGNEIFRRETNTNNAFTTNYTTGSVGFLNSFIEAEKDAIFIRANEHNCKFVEEKGFSRYLGESSAALNLTVKDGAKYKYDAEALYKFYNEKIKARWATNV